MTRAWQLRFYYWIDILVSKSLSHFSFSICLQNLTYIHQPLILHCLIFIIFRVEQWIGINFEILCFEYTFGFSLYITLVQFHGFLSQFYGKDFFFDAENWVLECWKDFVSLVNSIFQFGLVHLILKGCMMCVSVPDLRTNS